MNSIPFDTHAYVKKLEAAGFTEAQVEVQAQALAELVNDQLATKRDIEELRLATQKDIKELELRLREVEANLKRDIEESRLATQRDIEGLRLATQSDIALWGTAA